MIRKVAVRSLIVYKPLSFKIIPELVDEHTNPIPAHVFALVMEVEILIADLGEIELDDDQVWH